MPGFTSRSGVCISKC